MLIIGESINGTIPKVGQAIQEKNEAFLKELAKTQYECGAQMLDVNAGVAGGNEVEDLPWLIQLVHQEVPIPLMIDSANPDALKAALAVYRHAELPILNSVSGEEEKWKKLFPVISERGERSLSSAWTIREFQKRSKDGSASLLNSSIVSSRPGCQRTTSILILWFWRSLLNPMLPS